MNIEDLSEFYYFATPLYQKNLPEFLSDLKSVASEYIKKSKKDFGVDDIYPLVQTEDISNDVRVAEFLDTLAETGWNILNSQGYNMDGLQTFVGDIWIQSHGKSSSMDYHTHGYSAQLSGFYILECEKNCSKICIHDPRMAKLQVELAERDISNATYATRTFNFDPVPGDLYISNSWLPHSFTRNTSNKPFNFVHFNVYVSPVSVCQQDAPIII